jgi:dihydrofolate synthase / folylpolyglutamate synthase
MTCEALLKHLNARGSFRIRPSLGAIRKVLAVLGDPQDQIPSVHIAGTNGKGSVAASTESILRTSGYRTGLYTSPHLVDLRERIRVDGLPVGQEFARGAEDIFSAERRVNVSLTHFEFLTALAFWIFVQRKVDVSIIECGMGGRWDATNVLKQPRVSVITSIGLDHTAWLGKTKRLIAFQKAGIIKACGCVVSGVEGPGRDVIAHASRKQQAQLTEIGTDFRAEPLISSWRAGKQVIGFLYKGESVQNLSLGLLGRYQVQNAAVTLATVRILRKQGWRISPSSCEEGLRDVRWPGRMHLIEIPRQAPVILDSAHNPAAIRRLLESIQDSPFGDRPTTFVFSAFKDKDYVRMARMINRRAAEVCLCSLPGPRGATLQNLRDAFRGLKGPIRQFNGPRDALHHAFQDTPKEGLIVVTGSMALVGQILHYFQRENLFRGIRKDKAHV